MKKLICNAAISLIILFLVTVFLTSCKEKEVAFKLDEIKLAYTESAFDLPLIIAYHNGYFEEEGLNVTLVPIKESELGESITRGIVDGGTADETILIDLNKGLKAKIAVGLRGGCIEILASKSSGVTALNNLTGKKIGVEETGREQMAAAVEILNKNGVDGLKDCDWFYLKKDELTTALKEKTIDALVRWQDKENAEIPDSVILYQNSAMKEGSQGHSHGGNSHFYESFAVLSEDLAVNHEEEAVSILNAWVRGVNALSNGTDFQLEIAKESGFITDDSENDELRFYMFVPGVQTVPDNLKTFVKVEQEEGLLPKELDPEEFIEDVFIKLLPDWS